LPRKACFRSREAHLLLRNGHCRNATAPSAPKSVRSAAQPVLAVPKWVLPDRNCRSPACKGREPRRKYYLTVITWFYAQAGRSRAAIFGHLFTIFFRSMNSKQINQYDMYLRVHKTLGNYRPVWKDNPRFTANYEAFTEYLQAIKKLQGKLHADTATVSQQKAAMREQLTEMTVRLVRKLRSFAADTENHGLTNALDYSKSSLEKLRESQLPPVCLVVCEKGDAYLGQLGHYGVTAAELERVRVLAGQYEAILPEPKMAISTGKQATGALAELFRKTNGLLGEQLDGKLEQYGEAHADFYAAYFAARNVVDRTGRRVSEEEGETEKIA
jgi:hypothetical protein